MTKPLLNSFVALLQATLVLGGGQANAQVSQLLTSFTAENVAARLVVLGIPNPQVLTANTAKETHTAVVFDWQGATHFALLRACKPAFAGAPVNCFGLFLSTQWRNVGQINQGYVHSFNATHDFGKSFHSGQTAFYARYVISDGGITSRNFDSNVMNFLSMSLKFGAGLKAGAEAVSAVEREGADGKPGDAALLSALHELLAISPALRYEAAAGGQTSLYAPVLLHADQD